MHGAELALTLSHSIAGKRAFHRFKAALSEHPGRTDEWYEFRSAQLLRYMHAWLDAHEIVVPFDLPHPPSPSDGDDEERPPPWQRRRFDAVLEYLTEGELESVLALGELLRLDARARRRDAAGSATKPSPRA